MRKKGAAARVGKEIMGENTHTRDEFTYIHIHVHVHMRTPLYPFPDEIKDSNAESVAQWACCFRCYKALSKKRQAFDRLEFLPFEAVCKGRWWLLLSMLGA